MLTSLRNMFQVPDLRNKILFTLLILALYRLGSLHPRARHRPERGRAVPGAGASRAACSPSSSCSRAARSRTGGVRPRDHAVHHRVDHHAGAHGGDPQARAVAAAGRGRPAQDHPDDPLPHRRHRPRPGHRPGVPVPQRRRRVLRAAQNQLNVDLFGGDENFTVPAGRAGRPHAHRRHRAAHVDGRAHHPAGHRQRHVAAHLRLGRERPALRRRSHRRRGGHRAGWSGSIILSARSCWPASCSSSRASAASRCSSPSGSWAGACTAARAPTSRSRSTRPA